MSNNNIQTEYSVVFTGTEEEQDSFESNINEAGGTIEDTKVIVDETPEYLLDVLDEADEYMQAESEVSISQAAHEVAHEQRHLYLFSGEGQNPIKVLDDLFSIDQVCDDELSHYQDHLTTYEPTMKEGAEAYVGALVLRSIEFMIYNHLTDKKDE